MNDVNKFVQTVRKQIAVMSDDYLSSYINDIELQICLLKKAESEARIEQIKREGRKNETRA